MNTLEYLIHLKKKMADLDVQIRSASDAKRKEELRSQEVRTRQLYDFVRGIKNKRYERAVEEFK